MGTAVTKNIKKSNVVTGLMIVLLCFLILITGISFFLLYNDTIYNGVMIENIDVGGLSLIEAQGKVQNHIDKILPNYKIQFVYGDKIWNVDDSRKIGFSYDYTSAVHGAYNIGREGSYFERLQKIVSLYKTPYNISLSPIYDHNKFDILARDMKKDIDKPAKDATITKKNGKFVITDEEVGFQLNIDKMKLLMNEEIMKFKEQKSITINLPVEIISPKITSESLSTINDLLGSYTTKFNASNTSRSQNIILATRAMNGTLLMPGEIFSFNEVVGARSKEKGYQEAPVIFNGELVEGLGGGVCQVSSTMYNAILISNLRVIERVKHTIPSTYVPKGQDATVSYGVLDFKFENILAQPIYIESYVKGELVSINIYGRKINNQVVKIESQEDQLVKRPVEVKLDPNLLEGQERIEQKGRDGYKITTYKVIYENGVEIERKQISKDYYRPQKQIVIRGTKKHPAVSPQPKETKQVDGATTS